MAKIREELVLQDLFSGPLDKYINKMEKASASSAQTTGATVQMSRATQELVDKLIPLQSAFQEAFTEKEALRNMNELMSAMSRLGLVWTDTASEAHAADLIMNDGLQELANQGVITADAVARAAYDERAAKAAAKQAALEEKEAAKLAAAEKRAAEKLAVQAAKQAAAEEKAAAERAAAAQEKHRARIDSVKNALTGLISKLTGVNRAQNATESLSKQFRRFGLTIFSVSRILNALKSALERAPKSIQASWEQAGTSINNLFAGTVVSALTAMQPALDRLNAALNSEAGQKLARGLETLGNMAGQAIGFLLDKASQLVEFLGNNFQTVMTIAAIVAGVFAAQMALANLPLILFIGLVAALVVGLMKAGVTAEDIFGAIGSAAGWLYALVYNLIADAWNVIAVFAEFFANVFNDPVGAVARLFFDTFDAILGIVETVAGAIDALLGSDMAGAVSGFRSKMQAWVDDTFGENEIKIDRMEKIDYKDTMADWSSGAKSLANSLSDFSLGNMTGVSLTDISDDTGNIAASAASIEKSVNMADEDLRNLVDMAERQYVNQINLTAQTPIITVNGANTGRTQADRQALADAIAQLLREERAAGATRATATAYSGG